MSHIAPAELRTLIETGHAMVDVRSAAEYETAHIPGSVHIALDELRSDVEVAIAALPAGAVVICRSGARAATAAEVLATAGRDDLRILDGGIVAWERDGGALQRGRQHWDLERQVRLVAGSLVLGSVLASLVRRPAVALAGAVGTGLTVAALTDTCAMGAALARLPYNRDAARDAPLVAERFARLADHRAATAA